MGRTLLPLSPRRLQARHEAIELHRRGDLPNGPGAALVDPLAELSLRSTDLGEQQDRIAGLLQGTQPHFGRLVERRVCERAGGGDGGDAGPRAAMIPVPAGVRVWLASGVTHMRKGMNGLLVLVQEGLGRDPHAGDLFVLRGRRRDLIKVLWHDGLGLSLYATGARVSCMSRLRIVGRKNSSSTVLLKPRRSRWRVASRSASCGAR
jgi:hypothetical protein